MPIRSRQNSALPSACLISLSPLWPPWPPPNLSLTVPGIKSSSSCTTRICSGGILKKWASAPSARPLAFMKVCGAASRISPPGNGARPTKAWKRGSGFKLAPSDCASLSNHQKPALCRVCAYSAPGLPSPAISRSGTGAGTAELRGAPSLTCPCLLCLPWHRRPAWQPQPEPLRRLQQVPQQLPRRLLHREGS